MSSTSKNKLNVPRKNGDSLTTSYGDSSAGWASQGVRCVTFDQLTFELFLTKGSATKLYLTLHTAEEDSVAGGGWAKGYRAQPDGTMILDEYVIDLSSLGATERISFSANTKGASVVRLSAKVDSITGSPTMTVSAFVHNEEKAVVLDSSVLVAA